MNQSVYRFTLDMHSAQSQISIPVMLGDTSRNLRIKLTDGGVPYYIADGCLAKLSIKRPTETHLEEFCAIENNTVIVYKFEQNENTAIVEGIHECDITVYGSDGGRITAPRFSMVVHEKALNAYDLELKDEDRTAIDAILEVEANRQSMEAGRVNSELGRTEAESARAEAEQSRASEEANRVTAESSRARVESQRVDAEAIRVDAEKARANAEAERAKAEAERVASLGAILAEANEAARRAEAAADSFGDIPYIVDETLYIENAEVEGETLNIL